MIKLLLAAGLIFGGGLGVLMNIIDATLTLGILWSNGWGDMMTFMVDAPKATFTQLTASIQLALAYLIIIK
jgi:hypothetical protein